MNTCLVTTTIPYVNARPHIGFALELVQADTIARWHREQGDKVFFLSGTDENAIKNVIVAKERGQTPKELCDGLSGVFEQLIAALDISTDAFIRTSSDQHHRGARKFWEACRAQIERRKYSGLYCVGCEDFYQEQELDEGKCPTHQIPLEQIAEENYFFQLSRHTDDIRRLVESESLRILPETRRNEALGFLNQGLQDFSISRDISRSEGWGVRVPGDDTQTLYVWFDALTNYVNALGYADDDDRFFEFWQNAHRIVHVLGKDVLKFHALYWPGMLSAAGLRRPTDLHVHGFLTVDGQKIGKSSGNAVDPFAVIERYGSEALRYYLLRYVPTGSDSDFSHRHFADVYESDLANNLGNLVSRLEALAEKASLPRQPHDPTGPPEGLEDARFHRTIADQWETLSEINRDIESKRPWEYLRTGDSEQLGSVVSIWIRQLLAFTDKIAPSLPRTTQHIRTRFTKQTITRGKPLFPRLTSED